MTYKRILLKATSLRLKTPQLKQKSQQQTKVINLSLLLAFNQRLEQDNSFLFKV